MTSSAVFQRQRRRQTEPICLIDEPIERDWLWTNLIKRSRLPFTWQVPVPPQLSASDAQQPVRPKAGVFQLITGVNLNSTSSEHAGEGHSRLLFFIVTSKEHPFYAEFFKIRRNIFYLYLLGCSACAREDRRLVNRVPLKGSIKERTASAVHQLQT